MLLFRNFFHPTSAARHIRYDSWKLSASPGLEITTFYKFESKRKSFRKQELLKTPASILDD